MIERNLEQLDIMKVQNKLKLIDVIAYLLLEKHQFHLLKFVEKEQVVYDCLSDQVSFVSKYNMDSLGPNFEEGAKTYFQMMKESPEQATLIDQKLYSVLDEKIKKVEF